MSVVRSPRACGKDAEGAQTKHQDRGTAHKKCYLKGSHRTHKNRTRDKTPKLMLSVMKIPLRFYYDSSERRSLYLFLKMSDVFLDIKGSYFFVHHGKPYTL